MALKRRWKKGGGRERVVVGIVQFVWFLLYIQSSIAGDERRWREVGNKARPSFSYLMGSFDRGEG